MDEARLPGETPPLSALLDRLIDEAGGDAGAVPPSAPPDAGETRREAPSGSAAPPPPPDAGGLGALLGNPALMRLLPALLGGMNGRPPGGGAPGETPLSDRPSAPGGPPRDGQPDRPPDRHTALLCAVRPYLCPRRQQAVDSLMQVCRVRDAMRDAGVSLPPQLLSGVPSAPSSDRSDAPEDGTRREEGGME